MEERRSCRRMNITGQMLYDSKPARTVDMNDTALKFTCTELLPVGLLVDIAMDANEPTKKVAGEVVRSREIGNGLFECVITFMK